MSQSAPLPEALLQAEWWRFVTAASDIRALAEFSAVCAAFRAAAQRDELWAVVAASACMVRALRDTDGMRFALCQPMHLQQHETVRACDEALTDFDGALARAKRAPAARCRNERALPVYRLARVMLDSSQWYMTEEAARSVFPARNDDGSYSDPLAWRDDRTHRRAFVESLRFITRLFGVHSTLLSTETESMHGISLSQYWHFEDDEHAFCFEPRDIPLGRFRVRRESDLVVIVGSEAHMRFESWPDRDPTRSELELVFELHSTPGGGEHVSPVHEYLYSNHYDQGVVEVAVRRAFRIASLGRFLETGAAEWIYSVPCREVLSTWRGVGLLWETVVAAHEEEIARVAGLVAAQNIEYDGSNAPASDPESEW